MARKPNYDFERREREKARAAKKEDRARAKAERKEEATVSRSETPIQDTTEQP